MKQKNKKAKKGLSDTALTEKYEAGKQPLLKPIKKMLNTKPANSLAKTS